MQTRKGKNQALMSDVKSENQKSREEVRRRRRRRMQNWGQIIKSWRAQGHGDQEQAQEHKSTGRARNRQIKKPTQA